VKLSEGNMKRPLFRSDVTQTVEWQVDTFSDADSSKASQQEGIGIWIIFAAQFVLEAMIIFRGQRSGEVFRECRKIFGNNEAGLELVALSCQIV